MIGDEAEWRDQHEGLTSYSPDYFHQRKICSVCWNAGTHFCWCWLGNRRQWPRDWHSQHSTDDIKRLPIVPLVLRTGEISAKIETARSVHINFFCPHCGDCWWLGAVLIEGPGLGQTSNLLMRHSNSFLSPNEPCRSAQQKMTFFSPFLNKNLEHIYLVSAQFRRLCSSCKNIKIPAGAWCNNTIKSTSPSATYENNFSREHYQLTSVLIQPTILISIHIYIPAGSWSKTIFLYSWPGKRREKRS